MYTEAKPEEIIPVHYMWLVVLAHLTTTRLNFTHYKTEIMSVRYKRRQRIRKMRKDLRELMIMQK